MRSIINIVIVVIIAVVGYNYFFGSSDEKSESQDIVEQVKELGRSITDLVKSEKERMEEGKYDGFFDKIEFIFQKLESQLSSDDKVQKAELDELEKDKKELEEEVKDAEGNEVTTDKKDKLEAKLRELLEKTEKLLDESNK